MPGEGAIAWFHLFGSLAAVDAAGARVEFGPPKQRALLALLLMHAGEIVAVDRLIDLLWGEGAPRTAPHSSQIYISELRKALEPMGAACLIVTRPPRYLLDTTPDGVDAWRFENLVRDGARLLDAGQHEEGRAALAAALALWRGSTLADFANEEFAQP